MSERVGDLKKSCLFLKRLLVESSI